MMRKEKSRFRRFVEYMVSVVVVFFLVKAPIMLLVTEFLEVHYVLSALVAGVVPSVANFLPFEFWVWKKKKPSK